MTEQPPKLFISYSWSNAEHAEWVLTLATELCESGIDVILDKWALKEGHDAIAFMEQMVTDPEIKKVLMVCDETYASKADDRAGGVGTETQIISREVYEKQDQEKFVAVVTEKDADGKPYLPTYYKSRIYIDLSEADKYASQFEQLVRWVFGKPLYVKPPIGKAPAFVTEGESISLGTTALYRRCVDAIKNQKPFAAGAFDEYCTAFTANLERFRVPATTNAPEIAKLVMKSIEDFTPARNEALQLFSAVAQYAPPDELVRRTHALFENLLPYMFRPPVGTTTWNDWTFDNYKFISYELFLHTITLFIKHGRFEHVAHLLSSHYYVSWQADQGADPMIDFTVFQPVPRSLGYYYQEQGINKWSIRAYVLQERCKGVGVEFRDLMQADFVLYVRSRLARPRLDNQCWFPDTLTYLQRVTHSPFEIFARSVSSAYFARVKLLLGINTPEDVMPAVNGPQPTIGGGFSELNTDALLAPKKWATRP